MPAARRPHPPGLRRQRVRRVEDRHPRVRERRSASTPTATACSTSTRSPSSAWAPTPPSAASSRTRARRAASTSRSPTRSSSYLGETIEEGETKCEGVDDPRAAHGLLGGRRRRPRPLPEITTGDFNDLRLTENGAGITLFYGDPDADIPQPPTGAQPRRARRRRRPASTLRGPGDGARPPPAPRVAGETTTTTAAGGTTTTTAAP